MPTENLSPESHVAQNIVIGQLNNVSTPDNHIQITERFAWLKKNYLKLSLGALVVGGAVTLATNPLDTLEREVVQSAPWVGGGLVVSELLWVGGAGLMAGSAGKKVGNPFTLHNRWTDISQSVVESRTFKSGLTLNTIGALGTAGVVAVGTIKGLPVETWPGALGIVAGDVASTVAIRAGVFVGIKHSKNEKTATKEAEPKVIVRKATPSDIDRLADIDLQLFEKAYGESLPTKAEVVTMLTKRYNNNPGWMFVSELNGVVEGFVTAFKTNKSAEDFVSWENSTEDGTLDGKVDKDGKYVYVCNMTIKHEAVKYGAEEMLLANLFANGIEDGVQYGYFVARMPHFKRWLQKQGLNVEQSADSIQEHAETYLDLRLRNGKRYDPQLRMYESLGFNLTRMVSNAFEDDASMNYGVVFQADVPPSNVLKKIKPIRSVVATALRVAAKNPKVLKKVF